MEQFKTHSPFIKTNPLVRAFDIMDTLKVDYLFDAVVLKCAHS